MQAVLSQISSVLWRKVHAVNLEACFLHVTLGLNLYKHVWMLVLSKEQLQNESSVSMYWLSSGASQNRRKNFRCNPSLWEAKDPKFISREVIYKVQILKSVWDLGASSDLDYILWAVWSHFCFFVFLLFVHVLKQFPNCFCCSRECCDAVLLLWTKNH